MSNTKKIIDKKKNRLIKKYERSQLLSSSDVIQKRVEMINSFDYKKYKSICDTNISIENDIYLYKQEYVKAKKHGVDLQMLYDLAESLAYLQDIGFVHGDINRKNILYTDEGYKIIDFEPDLYQVKNGVKQSMITVPYISNQDKKNNSITNLTDKIGFCYFLLRISNKFRGKDIVVLSKHLNHYEFLGLKEEKIKKMDYIEIVNKYIEI